MFKLRELRPTSHADAEDYLRLLDRVHNNPDIAQFLPEIFDETSVRDVLTSLQMVKRYFISKRSGLIVGRAELTTHLNADPSLADKVPDHVTLGWNTCYFIDSGATKNLPEVHRNVARSVIRLAFQTQANPESSPWLPVAPVNDPSAGWLMLEGASGDFTVHLGEPQTGWFPQFGIGQECLHLAYATKE